MSGFFDHPKIKLIGAFLLWGLLCFAMGNGHATQAALQGSANWWQQKEHHDVAKVVEHQKAVDLGIVPK